VETSLPGPACPGCTPIPSGSTGTRPAIG
jgi:hypothetical protein